MAWAEFDSKLYNKYVARTSRTIDRDCKERGVFNRDQAMGKLRRYIRACERLYNQEYFNQPIELSQSERELLARDRLDAILEDILVDYDKAIPDE